MDSEALLRRVADEMEVRNVVARLAHLADTDSDDLEEYLSLWTIDGTSVHPHWEASGHEGIRTAVHELRRNGIQGPEVNVAHINTTLFVNVDGSEIATADSYWQYWRGGVTPPVI